ncbi:MAG: hydrogenase maturation nickel metallochaperone HypA [Limisphaerales bacterium]
MHEAGIIHNLLQMTNDIALKQKANRVLKLHLRVGSMSGVVPEALLFAFDAMRKNTIASEANLEIEIVQALCWCNNCNIEYAPEDDFDFLCPKCGGGNVKLIKGKELDLVSIDFC